MKPWDFHDTDGVDRVVVTAVRQVADGFAHIVANRLAAWARVRITFSVASVDQTDWGTFEGAVSSPGMLGALPIADGQVLIFLHAAFSMVLLDLHLAGTGSGPFPARGLSDVERQMLTPVMGSIGEGVIDAMSAVFGRVESGPVTLVAGATAQMRPNRRSACLLLRLTGAVSGVRCEPGQIDVCFPLDALRPLLAELSETTKPSLAAHAAAEAAASRVPLPLALRYRPVGIPLHVAENLAVGQVLALGHPIGEPLTLCAGDKELFLARAVEHNRRSACRLIDDLEPAVHQGVT